MASSTRAVVIDTDIAFAMLVAAILAVLLVPLPPAVLDLLQVLNLTLSLFILLMMFYLRSPLDFSSFPALLLVLTLFRLSLNVASTKLILLNGFAGHVIDAFGKLVVGSNYVVGAVMFLILVVIQFMVITKGAGRIAEVSARFTLDAMPGKQMSIDADLNAGIIDENEARTRRQRLNMEAEFYGSMDGASKFVKGDAVAALIITGINIVGGLGIGVLQRQQPVVEALQTYTLLTVGDGLVAQIPALMGSVAAGILVTKAADSGGLGSHIAQQLFRRPEPFFVCAAILGCLSVLPGMPHFAFLVIAVATAAGGVMMQKHVAAAASSGADAGRKATGAPAGARPTDAPAGDAADRRREETADAATPATGSIVLEIGFGLVPLVDPQLGGDLVDRLGMIRKQIRDELGLMIPPISVQDNLELGNTAYRVKLRGVERAHGQVYTGSHLAINPGDVSGQIEGIRVQDPAFNLPAVWISANRVEAAEAKGYTVVDCSSVVATHLTKVIRESGSELLSRQAVGDMIEKLKQTEPTVVNELIPQMLSVGVVHRVLQFLLAEQVPIHDLATVLETLADYAGQSKDPLLLSEFCRQGLKGHILSRHLDTSRRLQAMILGPGLDEELQQSLARGRAGVLNLSAERADSLTQQILQSFESCRAGGEALPVLLVNPPIRPHLFRLVHRKIADLAVLSYAEIMDEVDLRIVGNVENRLPKEAMAT